MSSDLKRTLDLKDSISVVAGSMIGCGIFIVSADMARTVNSSVLILFVWMIAFLFSLSGAIAYTEPVLNIKEDGGQYIFLKKMYNELTAFLYGWSLLTVIQTATIAAVCIAVGKFTGFLLPFISSDNYLIFLPIFKVSTQQLFAVLVCIILTYINSKGINYGVITQNIFTFTKILSIVGIIIFGIFFGCNYETILACFSGFSFSEILSFSAAETVATATVGAIFAMVTWNNITFISAEVKEPEKNIPKALFWGVISVGILYLGINMIYVFSISLDAIKNAPEDVVAVALMMKTAGSYGISVIALIILISACGSANGLIMTGARVYYKIAKDRLLFRSLAVINRKTKVPVNSLWLQCVWSVMYIIFCGSYVRLLDYVIYSALIFYVLTAAGIFVYRKRYKESAINRVNSFFALFFIVVGSYIIYSLTVNKFTNSMNALLIIASGILIYFVGRQIKNQKACVNPNKNVS